LPRRLLVADSNLEDVRRGIVCRGGTAIKRRLRRAGWKTLLNGKQKTAG